MPEAGDPAAELAGKEKGAKEQKEAEEKDQLAWHSHRDIFDNTALPAATTAVSKHPEGDSTQIDDLKKLREKAGKAASSGDYLGATQQIKAAIVVAERVILDEDGAWRQSLLHGSEAHGNARPGALHQHAGSHPLHFDLERVEPAFGGVG